MKKQNSSHNVKIEKVVVLVKSFCHYYHQFQLFQVPCKIAKEFVDQNLSMDLLIMTICTVLFEKLYTILR